MKAGHSAHNGLRAELRATALLLRTDRDPDPTLTPTRPAPRPDPTRQPAPGATTGVKTRWPAARHCGYNPRSSRLPPWSAAARTETGRPTP
ncbi:hypothetical protein GCM10010446_40460 [Streptomyces enissocaesilis]|uniref:Uncharacterized protein n=1 Tax=Streptomyces enissocaesilis TaxID=332589 RepID=A0ABP6JYF1_9ACTN